MNEDHIYRILLFFMYLISFAYVVILLLVITLLYRSIIELAPEFVQTIRDLI